LRFTVPDYLREVYTKFSIDLPRLNGDQSWTLAMPARYVIDRSGRVVAADCDPDYTNRPEPEKTLADLRAIG
jgi:peroxiredoxin